MSRTLRNVPVGKIFKTPKTTATKRALSFKDVDLLGYGIKPKSKHSFADAWDDKTISALYEKKGNR
jgi:hypothetical protein